MKSQVTLLLICMLFPKALSLICKQCLPLTSEPCKIMETFCPDQCLTSTTAIYISGAKPTTTNIQTCGVPDFCVNGSVNMGTVKVTTNTNCCRTDRCNTQTLPELPQQPPNGGMCYTCEGSSCSGIMSCTGNEDRCISATVKVGDNTESVKGCVSASLCAESSGGVIGVIDLSCCEGNLCNSAESFTLSFLPMIVPLLSSFLNMLY